MLRAASVGRARSAAAAVASTAARGVRGVANRVSGHAGLTRDANPHETLRALYAETAAALDAIPASAAYRLNVEKVTAHRLGLVNATPDVGALEAKIGVGAVEEVIAAAKAELQLIPTMAEWAPWKLPDGKQKVEVTLVE
ncbi:hypothetical protein BU14_0202s0018 [Porphyra umbilicalis]|uniref:NADH dehydrogenase [ubiquinone] 1 alpha subcomplex subunit 5 n=1 Tax=Porphyra umbilicalis TaxID=2786 RepID=A0A1X6P5Q4_PORUM|nr:hypothetical protein BU14_0202s0018 [Porphyra umbilicalis]|eukprot:OSX76231.1 hypothetical protein BU14_0202s0018 [Porphyra umbilicalis]